jgi:hypothetical protein
MLSRKEKIACCPVIKKEMETAEGSLMEIPIIIALSTM